MKFQRQVSPRPAPCRAMAMLWSAACASVLLTACATHTEPLIHRVPVEVTREAPVEVTREVEVTRQIPVEVIKEIAVEVPVEVTLEVPVEVTRVVPVEVIREVVKEVIVTPTARPRPTRVPTQPPSTPGPAAEQRPTGRIMFGAFLDGDHELFALDIGGLRADRLTYLTHNVGYASDGEWLSNRDRIMFSSRRDGAGDSKIFAADQDGSNITRLTSGAGFERSPAWSSVARRIAFTSNRERGDEVEEFDIFTMNPDGTELVRLTGPVPLLDEEHGDGTGYDPRWSPDGGRIVFSSYRDGNGEIYLMNADGSGVTRLTNYPGHDGEPDWSPDGQRIAFRSYRNENEDIYVMNATGGDVKRLTYDSGRDILPRWSPDGQWIAFISHRDGDYDIYAMRADGSGVTQLTNSGNLNIYVMNATGSGVTQLTNSGNLNPNLMSLAWSMP